MPSTFAQVLLITRTPIVLLLIGILIITNLHEFSINFILYIHNSLPNDEISTLPERWHLDYYLFPPNFIIHVICLAFGLLVLELRKYKTPKNENWHADLATLWLCLFLACLPVFLSTKETIVLNLVRSISLQILLYFLFFTLNSNLYVFRRYIEPKAWFRWFRDLTFPVSDIIFYSSHAKRISEYNHKLAYLPPIFLVLILAVVSISRFDLAYGSIKSEKFNIKYRNIEINDTYYAHWMKDTIWFTNTDWEDATSGIWIYDEKRRKAKPFRAVFDPHSFIVDDGYYYVFDRLINNQLLKVRIDTNKVKWKVPLKYSASYILRANRNTILATGEGGDMYKIRKTDGAILAKQHFSSKTDQPEIFDNGEVIYLDGQPLVQLLNSDLSHKKTVYLPPIQKHPELIHRFKSEGYERVASWAYYSAKKNQLYINAMWGEVYVMDLETEDWIQTFKVKPGVRTITVDETNNLLFASHFLEGYIDVVDINSGERLATILAAGTGRHINLNPDRKIGILHTNGRGMFKFDYSTVLKN